MPEQLSIPYGEITEVAGRKFLRENFTLGNKIPYWIQFDQILISPENKRILYEDIEQLAESIDRDGLTDPFEIDVLKDGRCFLLRGHRRHRAFQLLIEQGKFNPSDRVQFFPTKNQMTGEKRMADQFLSNNLQRPYTFYEQALVAHSLKYDFGETKSNEEVGKLMSVARTTVDNLILVANADENIKQGLLAGTMNPTEALKLIRAHKKDSKGADDAEEKSHTSSAAPLPDPKDNLQSEMKELEETELEAQRHEQRQKEIDRKENERLERDAVLVDVTVEALTPHIGKRLAAPARKYWTEEFVNPDGGEVMPMQSSILVMNQGVVINEQTITDLVAEEVKQVYVLKEIVTSASVITEPPAQEEKSKYDESREEIASINNAIKLSDRIDAHIQKLDVPDQIKKQFSEWCGWQMKDLFIARDYIHTHKDQNKRSR